MRSSRHNALFSLLSLLWLLIALGWCAGARAQSGTVPLTVEGSGFEIRDLLSGEEAFLNRPYVWQTIPPALAGWKFTEVNGGAAAKIRVRSARDGVLYVAATQTPAAAAVGSGTSSGWQRVPGLSFGYTDGKGSTLFVYRLPCPAGQTITVPQTAWAGTLLLAPEIVEAPASADAGATGAIPAMAALPPRDARPPGVVIDYLPAQTQSFVGSPTIAVLPDGTYVAAHDLFGPGAPNNAATRVFRSADRGATWQPLATLTGQTWSSLFVQGGALYLMGPNREFGQIVIRRSSDGGRTWTTPHGPTSGLLTAERGMHCAPTPITLWNGRLWRAFEQNPPGARGRQFEAFLLSAPEDADLLRATNWTRTNRLPYNPQETGGNWLEGNAVVTPGGGLVDILRISRDGLEKAALLTLTTSGQSLAWSPPRDRIDFPGGGVKFTIRYDRVSRRYWSLVNKQRAPRALRNVLSLISSSDLRNWTVEADLLQHPDTKKHAFQYVDWLFDGDDIIAVSRTSWDGDTYHNANYLTFHRIANFRAATRRTGP